MIISLGFGGPMLNTLMVTSASASVNLNTGAVNHPALPDNAGSMFLVHNVKAKGIPGVKMRL